MLIYWYDIDMRNSQINPKKDVYIDFSLIVNYNEDEKRNSQ